MSAAERPSSWPAPAKLNLFLHVLGRRADGYHELETVFQLIDLADTVRVVPRADGRVERLAGAAGVAEADDLAVRAALALREAAGRPELGASIAVEKRIPLGGGLGGGSSDAATVLVALDRLWRLELGTERLAAIGLGLGADVPLFVRGASAYARGIGERLTPIELPPRWFVVLDPGVRVATGEIFQAADLTRDSPAITIAGWLGGAATRNDLEAVVRRRHPEVARALDWLARHAPARLTGSGGCGFAAFEQRAAAESVVRACPAPWRAWVARGVMRSPLREALDHDQRGDNGSGAGTSPSW